MTAMTKLKVALLQTELAWENPEANLRMLQRNLAKLPAEIDLVVLPEMFSTGFTMNPQKVAEKNSGNTLDRVQQFSKIHEVAICGSFAAEQSENYFNRFFWVENGKCLYQYDKRHLFRMAEENNVYSQGEDAV